MAASTRTRLSALVLAGAALGLGPGAAQAAPNMTFKLPAHVIIEAQAHPGPGDPDRCIAYAFAEFPHIPKAVGYEVTMVDAVYGYDGPRVGPPFPGDDHSWYPAHWVAPAGFHRFALSGYSTWQGCAQAILGEEGRWSISKAIVSMSEKFTKQWRQPFYRCIAKRAKTYGEPVVLKSSKNMLAAERRGGQVTIQKLGSNQEQRVNMSVFLFEPTIVRTSALGGVVDLGGLGYEQVRIGPGMTVLVEANQPIKILERVSEQTLDDVPTGRNRKYEVRTSNCVVAARG